MKWYKSLVFKLTGIVAFTTLIVIGFLAFITTNTQRTELIAEVVRGATQLSEAVKRGTYYDMLEDRRENVYRTMSTIAGQEGIEKIRIFNKEGRIMFSTDRTEIGMFVDKKAEACYACHRKTEPLKKLEMEKRIRIFHSKDNHRVLGMITPVYNEPACWNASCHYHPPTQSVLGIIDILLSLENIDRETSIAKRRMALFAMITILTLSSILFFFLRRVVITPIRTMILAFRTVSEGNLQFRIPVKREDEVGYLFNSFNRMVEELKSSKEEMRKLIDTLDHKVEEKTREVKEAHKKLLISDKLASLGRLTASIAHEINNPLSGIITYLKLLMRQVNDGKPVRVSEMEKYLNTSIRELERISMIVKNLLDFSRQKEPEKKEVNLKDIIEDALFIMANHLKLTGVDVKMKVEFLPPVMGDPSQLKQVFLNLFYNAVDAMKDSEKKILTIEGNADETGRYISIYIRDTGMGIPEENLSKIFEPFFTTKEKGTGLGLSVAYGIIMSHGGEISIESKVNEGTCVTIKFPL